jgi:hypothetical protein
MPSMKISAQLLLLTSKTNWVNYRHNILLLLMPLLVFSSCEMINPDEEIPAYLTIDTILLSTQIHSQGPANHKITDAWITVNGDFIGVFELPCKVPVLASGEASIYVQPGIKNNGIASSRIYYPFYTIWNTTIELTPGELHSLTPQVSYRDETIFEWYENFEDPGISLDTTFKSEAALRDTFIYGSNAGKVLLTGDQTFFDAETMDLFQFPNSYTPSLFIEMDYQASNILAVGIVVTYPGEIVIQPLIFLNPTNEWNKIYIDASYYAQTAGNATGFRIFFQASKNDTIPTTEIVFDNLKLLHF